jgi:TonB-dependent receptor
MSIKRASLFQSLSALALLVSAASPAALAQNAAQTSSNGVLTGIVTDPSGAIPLAGATVVLSQTGQRVSTSPDGRFRFINLPPGSYTLVVDYLGAGERRVDVALTGDGAASVEIALATETAAVNEIVVTGARGSLARARAQELNADQFKTIVAADAIGNFADQNVAESLQRLPGLSIRRSEGEGQQVAVRGLSGSFVTVTVDGAKLGTRDVGSRSVNLDVISSDLLNGIEVTKSLTPDLDADAVAGNVNLRSLSAFDRKGDSFSLRTEASYEEKAEAVNPKISGDFTKLFAGEKWGIAGGASWSRREAVVDEFSVDDGLRIIGPAGGPNFISPRRFNLRNDPAVRTRFSANLGLEFRPSPDHEFFLRGSYATFTDDDIRARTRVEFDDATGVVGATGSRIISATPTSFTGNRIDVEKRFRFTDQEDVLLSGSAGGESVFGAWTINYQVDHSTNDSEQPSVEPRFRERDLIATFNGLNRDGATFSLAPDPSRGSNPNNPATFDLRFITQYDIFVEDVITAGKIDAQYDTELFTRPGYFKFGVKGQTRTKEVDEDRADINARAPTTLAAFDPRVPQRTDLNVGFFPNLQDLRNFALAEARAGIAAGTFTPLLVDSSRNDWTADEQVLSAYAMSKFALTDRLEVIAGVRVEQTEWTSAGNTTDVLTFNTDVTNALNTLMTRAITTGAATFTAAQRDAFLAQRRSATGAAIEERLASSNTFTGKKTYTDVFPSINVRWDLTDTVLARFAFTTATQRPDFDQASAIRSLRSQENGSITTAGSGAAANTTFTRILNGQTLNTTILNSTGITTLAQAANLVSFRRTIDPARDPNLDPLRANQFDASLSWYPSNNIYLSAAAFYKDLTDFVVPTAFSGADVTRVGFRPGDGTIDGGIDVVQTFINGDNAKVYGVELAYTQNFTFLPGPLAGLFFSGNVTVSESSAKDALVGREFTLPDQADLVYNLSAGWENKDFSIRWSGNFAGERLVELNGGFLGLGDPSSDIIEQERFSMDVNLRWNLADGKLQLYADAININDAEDKSYFRASSQGGIFFLRENYGPTYQVGLKAKF